MTIFSFHVKREMIFFAIITLHFLKYIFYLIWRHRGRDAVCEGKFAILVWSIHIGLTLRCVRSIDKNPNVRMNY